MTFLRIFTLNAIDYLIPGIVDFKLLEFLCPATTVEDSFFDNFTNVFVLIINSHLWSITGHEAKIKIPKSNIGRVIIIIFPHNTPWSMTSRDQNPIPKTNFLFKR